MQECPPQPHHHIIFTRLRRGGFVGHSSPLPINPSRPPHTPFPNTSSTHPTPHLTKPHPSNRQHAFSPHIIHSTRPLLAHHPSPATLHAHSPHIIQAHSLYTPTTHHSSKPPTPHTLTHPSHE
ncbi:hypothetical protein Pcinc_011987 [Petrolisthes cinctipes]|uniref:Uncharacterized protein n=1 Tax=Petrolisthes cinctipes TaxID=88211 RepID=A0AAE1FZS5_PETCI|nr:hypothetical protein Pcinc_011987 [Petrolisthes cinctipes]